jgi:hypothetical protein
MSFVVPCSFHPSSLSSSPHSSSSPSSPWLHSFRVIVLVTEKKDLHYISQKQGVFIFLSYS